MKRLWTREEHEQIFPRLTSQTEILLGAHSVPKGAFGFTDAIGLPSIRRAGIHDAKRGHSPVFGNGGARIAHGGRRPAEENGQSAAPIEHEEEGGWRLTSRKGRWRARASCDGGKLGRRQPASEETRAAVVRGVVKNK